MWILAHRGASRRAPENTLRAFRLALHQGVDNVEFDTYQVEGEIMIFHDRYLRRMTGAEGRISDATVDGLRQLDAGQGEPVPYLSEVLGLYPANAICNIEIKALYDVDSWLNALDSALRGTALTYDNLIISSFNHRYLQQISQRSPTLKIGALSASYPLEGVAFATALSAYSVHIAGDVVDHHYVTMAKNAGLKVLVYTVDEPDEMRMLANWGVDGIFTNVPDIAKAVLLQTEVPSVTVGL